MFDTPLRKATMTITKSLSKSGVALIAALTFPTACGSSDSSRVDPDAADSTAPSAGGSATVDSATGGATAGGSTAGAGGASASHGTGGHASGEPLDAGTGAGGASGEGDASTAVSVLPVDLGAAANFVILAKTGISTVPTSAVTGDIGVSPAAATYITGFALVADSTNAFATSPQITGSAYAANYASPTPSRMTTAVSDMEHAFSDAAGRAPGVTELGAGNIGAMTLSAGVYEWGTGVLIPTDLTLAGDRNAVWIFQIAKGLTVSPAVKIVLKGGALARNIFWEVAGKVEVGTTAHLEGIVLCRTSVMLRTGASIGGRLLSQTAVTIDGSTVAAPAP
jgi:hypothetical protein